MIAQVITYDTIVQRIANTILTQGIDNTMFLNYQNLSFS
jgi:hypothetical protein